MSKSQTTNTLKLSFKDEVFKTSKPANLSTLLKAIKETFPELSKNVSLKYEDAEGDKVVIATEEDYQTALATFESQGKTLKVYVAEKSSEANPAENDTSSSFVIENKSEAAKDDRRSEVTIEEEKPEEQEILITKDDNVDVQEKVASPKEEHIESEEDRKFDKIREITKQTLQEELPTIALIVKQLLEGDVEQQPRNHFSGESRANSHFSKRVADEKSNKPVHHGVSCDVCGVHPIVGDRFKSTVLHDYDLCSACEAKVDHPYPLLKLKNETQSSIKVITVIPPHRDVPHRGPHNFRGFEGTNCQRQPHQSSRCDARAEGGFGAPFQGFQNLFGGLLQQFSKPEETEKLSNVFKNGFEVFQGVLNNLKTQFEVENSTQAQTKDNSKEETKEAPPTNSNRTNTSEKRSENAGEKPSKDPHPDFNFVGQLLKNLFSEVIQNAGDSQSQTQTQEKQKDEQEEKEEILRKEKEEILRKAKALFEIFPQSTLEDLYELIKYHPFKSVEQLATDFLASF